MENNKNRESLILRLQPQLKANLKSLAIDNRRSTHGQIVFMLEKLLNQEENRQLLSYVSNPK